MAVATQGELTYNGITFGPMTRTKVSGRPVKSADGRSVAYVEWTIEAESYVAGGTGDGTVTSDDTLTSLRRALTKPGQSLTYTDKGFGDLVVNTPGDIDNANVKDIEWGPWPELLSWMPCGGNVTAFVTWRCVTRIPECSGAKYTTEPVEIAYTVSTEIDQDGYSTLTTSGHVTIPMTRIPGGNNTGLPDNVDRMREKVRPAILPSFQRVSQSFRTSEDRRTLHFTFTDKQVPVPLPDHLTRADVRQRISSNMAKGFNQWAGTINGTLTVAAGEPKVSAYNRMLVIVHSRLKEAANKVKGMPLPMIGGKQQHGMLIIESVEFDEEIFGRSFSFNVGYRLMGTSIGAVMAVAGFFSPVKGTSFKSWQTSLTKSASHVRGAARVEHTSNDDVLVDLCLGGSKPNVSAGRIQLVVDQDIQGATPEEVAAVEKKHSWLGWSCNVHIVEDDKKVRHKPLGVAQQAAKGISAFGKFAEIAAAGAKGIVGGAAAAGAAGAAAKDWVQTVAAPSYRLMLTGSAKRLGHAIPIPLAVDFGGAKFELGKRNVQSGTSGAVGGVPIYWATWEIEYLLDRKPAGEIPVPSNPMLELDSSETAADQGLKNIVKNVQAKYRWPWDRGAS